MLGWFPWRQALDTDFCLSGGLRAKRVGFGVTGSFGGSVTEYSWDDLTYFALNISSSLWAFLPYDAHLPQCSCLECPRLVLHFSKSCTSLKAQHLRDIVMTNYA